MKKGRNFYASLLLFTAALCPLSGNPDFGAGPAKAAEATVSIPKKLQATVKKGYVKRERGEEDRRARYGFLSLAGAS